MGQLVKSLQCRPEDLRSTPRTHMRNWVCRCTHLIPVLGRDGVESWASLANHSSPVSERHIPMRYSILKSGGWLLRNDT